MLAIAASLASGIRVNFGIDDQAAARGARRARTASSPPSSRREGFTGGDDGLDGQWGFFQVLGGGADLDRLVPVLGKPHTIVTPGVSIKPYPCGVLGHPSMDAMLKLVIDHDVKPEQIRAVRLRAGSNILNPLRYKIAKTELEAKFSLPFMMSAIVAAAQSRHPRVHRRIRAQRAGAADDGAASPACSTRRSRRRASTRSAAPSKSI